MKLVGYAACMRENMNVYIILVGRLEGKRSLGRPKLRWENNIKIDLRESVWGGMDWTHLVQNRNWWKSLMKTVRNLRIP
jgi:hypothetical protein